MPSPSSSHEHHDAIKAEEIAGTARPAEDLESRSSQPPKRPNAFTELMKPKKPKKYTPPPSKGIMSSISHAFSARDGLGAYIEDPASHARVVEYDDEFVLIKDMYPKASVHLLLLPRNPSISNLHPLHALSTNETLLSSIRARLPHIKQLAANELRRLYGQDSTSDAPYQTALEAQLSSAEPPVSVATLPSEPSLPPGRDWISEISAGVHTHPSMSHLHVHIISRDMHSECLKHKKHYLSFNSSFFVKIEEFPLDEETDQKRFHPGDWPNWDMTCWRCGREFENRRFAKLKAHLEEEFEEWRRE